MATPEAYLSLFGKIPDFDLKLATFRSLRISADIIVQSIAQLKEMYEDRHGKITSNCSVTILLGANDIDDCKWFSDLIGQTTVRSESINIDNKGLIQGSSGGSISDNAQLLMRPEQIRAMDKDQCLILVNTCNPIKDKKYNSLKHPRWKETFSDKDPELKDNEFQYRRLFFIEQDDNNRVSAAAALNVNNAQPQTLPNNSVSNPVDTIKRSRINENIIQPNTVGVDLFRESTERYNRYKKQKEQASLEDRLRRTYADSINENDEIKVHDLNIDARTRLLKGVQDGSVVVENEKVKIVKSKADIMDEFF